MGDECWLRTGGWFIISTTKSLARRSWGLNSLTALSELLTFTAVVEPSWWKPVSLLSRPPELRHGVFYWISYVINSWSISFLPFSLETLYTPPPIWNGYMVIAGIHSGWMVLLLFNISGQFSGLVASCYIWTEQLGIEVCPGSFPQASLSQEGSLEVAFAELLHTEKSSSCLVS